MTLPAVEKFLMKDRKGKIVGYTFAEKDWTSGSVKNLIKFLLNDLNSPSLFACSNLEHGIERRSPSYIEMKNRGIPSFKLPNDFLFDLFDGHFVVIKFL